MRQINDEIKCHRNAGTYNKKSGDTHDYETHPLQVRKSGFLYLLPTTLLPQMPYKS